MEKSSAQLIVALDLPDRRAALNMADQLQGLVKWLKVGLQLYTACGPDLVLELRKKNFNIFLDLKFFDIPNTVAGAVISASRLECGILTIHAQGGERMCKAALEASRQHRPSPLIACVTALTSFDANEMPGISESPEKFAFFLAAKAQEWNMEAIVCSPLELSAIKKCFPNLKCICPGLRLPDNAMNDQRRTSSPAEAVANGADFLVMGRPILKAADPARIAETVIREMEKAENS